MTWKALAWTVLFALAIITITSAGFAREGAPHDVATQCRYGVLLPHAESVEVNGKRVHKSPLFDGVFAIEGSAWPESGRYVAVKQLSAEFGAPVHATSIVVQTDADSPYRLEFSGDGSHWEGLRVPALKHKSGMITRRLPAPPSGFRYVRLLPDGKLGPVPTSEVQLLCGVAPLHRTSARDRAQEAEAARASALESEDAAARSRRPWTSAVILFLALLLVVIRKRVARVPRLDKLRLGLLAVLALVSASSYFQLGAGGPLPHAYELFHYQLGSKYFSELRYDLLYDCATVAESEAGFGARIASRTYRDLRTNQIRPATDALRFSGLCHKRLSPRRWKEFSADVSYYARALGVRRYTTALRDHGFNGTPTWLMLGDSANRLLGNSASAHGLGIGALGKRPLTLLDIGLLLGIVLMLAAAFGWETTCLAAIAIFANPLATAAWTLGAFLRYPWIFALFAGIAALYRQKPGLAGALLAISAMLRVFPGLMLAGPVLALFWCWARRKRPPTELQRLLVGAAVALVAVTSVTVAFHGLDAFRQSAADLWLQAGSDSQNAVGLRALLSFRPWTRASLLFDPARLDPFAAVLAARRSNFQQLFVVDIALSLVAVGLLGRVVWRRVSSDRVGSRTLLQIAIAGLLTLPLLVNASSYYYAFLAVFVLLPGSKLAAQARTLGLLSALSLVGLGGPMNDQSYAIASLLIVLWSLWMLWSLGSPAATAEQAEPEEQSSPTPAPTDSRNSSLTPQQWVYVLAGVVGLVGVVRALATAWTSDDAFISFRYAANLLAGHGLVYNAGEHVQGYTNLLFTLLVAFLHWLSLSAPTAANGVGVAAFIGVFVLLLLGRRHARPARLYIPLAALLWALQGDVVTWATGGLETTLFTFLAVAGILTVLQSDGRLRRAVLGGVLLGLTCATRPDGVLFAAVGVAIPLFAFPDEPWRPRLRAAAWVLLPLAVIGVCLAAFNIGYYGSLLPTTFYAKSALRPYYSQGLWYVGLYFLKNWPIAAALLLLPWAMARAGSKLEPRRRRELGAYATAAAVFTLYVAHSGGGFMYARRLIPVLPFLFLTIEGLVESLPSPARWGAELLLSVATLFPLRLFPSSEGVRIHGVDNEPQFYPPAVIRQRTAQGRLAGRLLRGLPIRAAFAGGMCVFAYESHLPYLVEPNGLTNMTLARARLAKRGPIPGHEKAASWAALRRLGLQMVFRKGTVPHRAPGYDEVFFGDQLRANLLVYDKPLMDRLARIPGIRFQPISVTLRNAAAGLAEASCDQARGILRKLDSFYLYQDPEKRAAFTREVEARCTTPSH